MNKKTVKDIDIKGKRVLMRVDFNVPMNKGEVSDDKRIRAALPTIKYVLDQNASLVLMSHLGRPKGSGFEPDFSLKPVSKALEKLLGKPVLMAPDCIGEEVVRLARNLKPGEVMLLENVRFHKEEEKNDPAFAKQLSMLGDVYVNDAFGSAHRAHASTEGVAKYLPAVSGFLMEQELEYLSKATINPEHPYIAILGGAKISDKIAVIENLLKKCDTLIIGGGMANTFLAAKGFNMAESLVEQTAIQTAKDIISKANTKLLLPIDAVVGNKANPQAQPVVVDVSKIPSGGSVMDIGPKSIDKFTDVLKNAKLIVWNGPLGVFEDERYSKGTFEIAKFLATLNATTVIGGGDSASAVKKAGVAKQMTHVSTGGGASLEFLEGKILPGVAALLDN